MGEIRKRFTTGDVDRVRLVFLKRIYEEDANDELHIKRQAVRQLMGPIIAARKSGMTFERIVEIFKAEGLEITPATLRSYYFDFKAEVEGNKLTARQVEQIQETRDRLTTENVVKKGDQAHRTAAREARKLTSRMKIVPAAELLAESERGLGKEVSPERRSHSDSTRRPTSSSKPVAPAPSPSKVVFPSRNEKDPGERAPTLDELRKHADGAEGKEELSEDVVLKTDNRVYYASGEPFDGILTSRQLRLLEVSRRLVAPKKDAGGQRTAVSFTKLPGEL